MTKKVTQADLESLLADIIETIRCNLGNPQFLGRGIDLIKYFNITLTMTEKQGGDDLSGAIKKLSIDLGKAKKDHKDLSTDSILGDLN